MTLNSFAYMIQHDSKEKSKWQEALGQVSPERSKGTRLIQQGCIYSNETGVYTRECQRGKPYICTAHCVCVCERKREKERENIGSHLYTGRPRLTMFRSYVAS